MSSKQLQELISQRKEWEVWADCGNGLERQTAVENVDRLTEEISNLQRYFIERREAAERKRARRDEAQAAKAAAEQRGDFFHFIIYGENKPEMVRICRSGDLMKYLDKIANRPNWRLFYYSPATFTTGGAAKRAGKLEIEMGTQFEPITVAKSGIRDMLLTDQDGYLMVVLLAVFVMNRDDPCRYRMYPTSDLFYKIKELGYETRPLDYGQLKPELMLSTIDCVDYLWSIGLLDQWKLTDKGKEMVLKKS